MIIDRPHRVNGELVGYHLSMAVENGAMKGKFIDLDRFNLLSKQTEIVNEEKHNHRIELKKINEPEIVQEQIIEIIEEPKKRGRKKAND